MYLPKILFPVFMFTFVFSLPLIFTLLAASISHFLTSAMKFSCFSSNDIFFLCFQSLALALSLLSTGIKRFIFQENFTFSSKQSLTQSDSD